MTALMLLVGFLALPLYSCHTIPSPPIMSLPFPPGTEPMVQMAEEIGQAIFEQDDISAKATDAMFRENILQRENRLRGWITFKQEGRWLVRFIGKPRDEYVAYYDVKFPFGEPPRGKVIRLEQPEPLPVEQVAMVKARELAIQAMPMRCSDRYNTVILPGNVAHVEGWVVYLLAATTTPDEVMIGGHFRVELSTTGTEVKQVLSLSKTCIRLPPPGGQGGMQAAAAATTHIISDTPIETHVFLSLLHRKPIYVSTRLGLWKVEEGRIGFLEKMEP